MKWVNPYSAPHHVPALSYLARKPYYLATQATDFLAGPLTTDIGCCLVCGCSHSGMTLLSARLGNHPMILFQPQETGVFLPRNTLFQARREIAGWLAEARARNKRTILEKTPSHINVLGRVRRLLPRAKILITTRNPLDNIASLVTRFGDVRAATDKWIHTNSIAVAAREDPDVLIIKYEEMTADPVPAFGAALDFIGLPWQQGITDASGTGLDGAKLPENMRIRARQVKEPIRANINTWQGVIGDSAGRAISARVAPLAARLGYSEYLC